MRVLKLAAISLAFASTPLVASAEYLGDHYVGASVEAYDLSASGWPTFRSYVGAFKAGMFLNDYLAIEGKVGFGIHDKKKDYNFYGDTLSVSAGIDHYISVLAVGAYPVHEKFDIYAKAGFSSVKLRLKFESNDIWNSYTDKITDTETSFSAFAGIAYYATPTSTVNLEYGQLLDKSGISVDGLSLGLTKYF